jgi:hypothetical protein
MDHPLVAPLLLKVRLLPNAIGETRGRYFRRYLAVVMRTPLLTPCCLPNTPNGTARTLSMLPAVRSSQRGRLRPSVLAPPRSSHSSCGGCRATSWCRLLGRPSTRTLTGTSSCAPASPTSSSGAAPPSPLRHLPGRHCIGGYRKSTKSWANLPTQMYWHEVLERQHMQQKTCLGISAFTVVTLQCAGAAKGTLGWGNIANDRNNDDWWALPTAHCVHPTCP